MKYIYFLIFLINALFLKAQPTVPQISQINWIADSLSSRPTIKVDGKFNLAKPFGSSLWRFPSVDDSNDTLATLSQKLRAGLLLQGGANARVVAYDSITKDYKWLYQTSTPVVLTYGRVNASANLASTTYVSTGVGTKIPFNATVYSGGMAFSGTDGIIPSVSGRYQITWLAIAGSAEFAGDGTYHVVQNGVSVGSVFMNQMEAAGVNQTTPTIAADLIAGLPVTLHYQPVASEAVIFERGSYFDITQISGLLPVTAWTNDNVLTGLTVGQTVGAVGTPLSLIAKTGQGISVATNQVVLNGGLTGKTFKAIGSIARMNGTAGSGEIAYQFRNVTASVYIGNEGAVTQNTALGAGSVAFADIVVAAGQSVTIQLWVTKNTNAGTLGVNGAGGGGAGTFYIYQDGASATTDYGGWLTNSTAIYPSNVSKNVGVGTQTPLSTLEAQGSLGLKGVNIATATYTATATDYHIRLTLAGSQTLTLPAANTATGRVYRISNPTGYLKTISSIIDMNQLTTTQITSHETFEVQSDGTNWNKIMSSSENFDTQSRRFVAGAFLTGSLIVGSMEFSIVGANTTGATTFLQARLVGTPASRNITGLLQRQTFATIPVMAGEAINPTITTTYTALNTATTSFNANYISNTYILNDRTTGEKWTCILSNDGSINANLTVTYTRP